MDKPVDKIPVPVRVLMVEDEPSDAELIVDDLRDDGIAFTHLRVDTEAGFLDALASFQPDIVLSDLKLPAFDGYRALALLRQRDNLMPFIFVSGTIGEDVAVEALHKGATDYILKHNTVRLASAVRRALREAVEQRARQQAEEELIRAQRFESLALLAGGMSHDLRNLLQPLLLAADTLEGYRDDERLMRLGAMVRDCVHRGLDMVTSMLTFARGARRNDKVRVGELFEALGLLLKGSVPRTVTLDIDAPDDDLVLEGNHTELQQSLLNLCLNAIQAMPEGGRLGVAAAHATLDAGFFRTGEQALPGTYVCLRVADTGSGMSEATLGNLFQPFFTTKSSGTGLGLVSCKRIVDSHGGVIRVTSTLGQGTCFALYLPESARRGEGDAPTIAQGGHGERILLVDEDAVQLSFLFGALDGAGYDVHASQTGTAALQALESDGLPQLVVMDADMNLMTGARTLAGLLEREYRGAVLLMARPDARPSLDDLPPIQHMALVDKPVEGNQLLCAVRGLLDASCASPERSLA
ncbi:MAG TPA: response regulator [Rhodanobacteraceae bacterium]